MGFTLYCTRNLKGNFKVGMRTEKSRLRRSLMSLCDQIWQIRHLPIQEQVDALKVTLRGHYAYNGVAGNIRALQRCTGSSCVIGARCSVAAAGQAATSPRTPSIGS